MKYKPMALSNKPGRINWKRAGGGGGICRLPSLEEQSPASCFTQVALGKKEGQVQRGFGQEPQSVPPHS